MSKRHSCGKRLFATQNLWTALVTSNPPRELVLILADLDDGSLQAYRRGKRVVVLENQRCSRWVLEGLQRGRLRHQRSAWRRCRILEHLLEVLNFDATTTTLSRDPEHLLEAV